VLYYGWGIHPSHRVSDHTVRAVWQIARPLLKYVMTIHRDRLAQQSRLLLYAAVDARSLFFFQKGELIVYTRVEAGGAR